MKDMLKRLPSPMHALTLIYLALAKEADGEVSDEEMEMIGEKIQEWVPDQDIKPMLRQTVEVYVELLDYPADMRAKIVMAFVDTLGDIMTLDNKHAIVADLRAIANADGWLLKNEKELVEAIADRLGVSM